MRSLNTNAILLLPAIVLVGCYAQDKYTGKDLQVPSPDQFPREWLKEKVTVQEVERRNEYLFPEAHWAQITWQQIRSEHQPGDEVWAWEEPDRSKPYGFGYCLLRNGKIIKTTIFGKNVVD